MDIKSFFSFKGRANRSEWWGVVIGFALLFYAFDSIFEGGYSLAIDLIMIIIVILMAWMSIATNTRRCHDLGHSGFWQFIPFYAIWLGFVRGTSGDNEYGPDPSGKLS